jgi:hypothetical protein
VDVFPWCATIFTPYISASRNHKRNNAQPEKIK